jgi:type II secretory ATPase GspE/PulE/Tfp pilus assembly ATPase PilB-like protein
MAALDITQADLSAGTIFTSVGCPSCLNTGYAGRTAIYEIMVVHDDLRAMVLQNLDSTTIKRHAIDKHGMQTLRMDGAQKVRVGMTSIEEVLRVTQADFA